MMMMMMKPTYERNTKESTVRIETTGDVGGELVLLQHCDQQIQ
jgi:hypothetical protein